MANPEFKYSPMFQLGKDDTEYYLLTKDHVSVGEFEGHPILKVEKEGLTAMANAAFHDVSFMLRRSHNEQVAKSLTTRGKRERQVCRIDIPPQRRRCHKRRIAIVPGHRHRHYSRRKRSTSVDWIQR